MQMRIKLRDCGRGEGWRMKRMEEDVSCPLSSPQSGVVSEQLEGCVFVGGCVPLVTHQDDT